MAVNRRLASISCIGRAIDAPGVDAVAMWTTLVDRETRSERFASLSTLPGMNSSNGCGAGGARPPTAITATPVRAKAIASALPMRPLPPRIRTVSATVVLRQKALIDAMLTMGTVVPGPNLRGPTSPSGFSKVGVDIGNSPPLPDCWHFAGDVSDQSGLHLADVT